jgi:transglycosylase-like protein
MRTAERSRTERPARPPRARRRPVLIVVGAVAACVVGVLAAAWFSVPSGSDTGRRVAADLRRHGSSFVPIDDVAPQMRQAVVATEDERFYRHHGIDVIGLARSAAYDVTHVSLQQGASTITEQLAKELYLDGNDHSPWRKLQDAALAVHLESHLSKDQILGDYLNTVYFGAGAFGVGRASERYFGVAPSRLSLPDASLLAGLIQAPSADDPFADPSAARSRQEAVLTSMIRNHDITIGEGALALSKPLRLAGGRTLPGVTGVDLAPGPAFSGPQMAVGIALLIAFLVFLLSLWRSRRSLWRLVPAIGLVIGLLLVARSLRGD